MGGKKGKALWDNKIWYCNSKTSPVVSYQFLRIAINTKNKWTIWKLLELLSDNIFDAEEKPDITDELVSFDGVIILELQWMVDLMIVDDLLCRLVIDAWSFLNDKNEHPSESVCNAEVLGILLCELCIYQHTNF